MIHQEYPKTLVHPHARQGKATPVHGTDPESGRQFVDYQGTPDMFPPVTVSDPDSEALHRAKGYRPAGESDAAAFANSFAAPPSDFVHAEYPKFIATAEGGKIVNSAAEEGLAVWKVTVAERAAAPKPMSAKEKRRVYNREWHRRNRDRRQAAKPSPDSPPAA